MSKKPKQSRAGLRFLISAIVFVLATFVVLPTVLPEGQNLTIIGLLGALITAIATVEPISNQVIRMVDFFTNRAPEYSAQELREGVLERQRAIWVQGVLKRTIRGTSVNVPFQADEAFIRRLAQRAEARQEDDPLRFDERNDNPYVPLPWMQFPYSIADAYAAARTRLVILGEAGSGKTTALLDLLDQLARVAEADIMRPDIDIPVVFNLGSWTVKQLPLKEWLVSEILETFEDPPAEKAIRALVDQRELVFLIDGFDHLPGVIRSYLLREIHDFIEEKPTALVLCSRPDAYEQASRDLQDLPQAIRLQGIPDHEIRAYLDGNDYQQIREIIFQPESRLYPLAQKPFVLHALAIGYAQPRERDIEVLEQQLATLDIIAQDDPIPPIILTRYINQQFRKVDTSDYDEATTSHYLSWVARKLDEDSDNADEESRNEFYIEHLQPVWLDGFGWQWAYSIVSRMLSTTAILFGIGFLLSSPLDFLWIGMLAGAAIGISHAFFRYNQQVGIRFKSGFRLLLRPIVLYFYLGLVLMIPVALIVPAPPEDKIMNGVLSLSGITLSWFVALFVSAIYATRDIQFKKDIKPVEGFRLSLKTSIRYGVIGGLLVGVFIGVFAELLAFRELGSTTRWLNEVIGSFEFLQLRPFVIGFAIAVFFASIITAIFGFLSVVEVKEKRLRPQQGIEKSLLNAVRVGGALSIVLCLIFGAMSWQVTGDIDAVWRGIRNGLSIGILGGLWYGGIDAIHHAVLRYFLFISGKIPWQLPTFLKYSDERNLMREIGAAYIFAHDYLRDFYTTFKSSKPPVPNFRSVPIALGVVMLVLIVFMGTISSQVYGRLFPFNQDTMYMVSSYTPADINGNTTCFNEDEQVTVYSRGLLKTGNYMGYISPEGSEIGFMGFIIGDTYDIAPELPHGNLICKFTSQTQWQQCSQRTEDVMLPWAERRVTLPVPQDGDCLEFHVNSNEVEKISGSYFVRLERSIRPNAVTNLPTDPAEGLTFDDALHRSWYDRFWTGSCEDVNAFCVPGIGWMESIHIVLEKTPMDQQEQMAERLWEMGRAAGHDWARDNNLSQITTNDLMRWGQMLSDTEDTGTTVNEIEGEVCQRLRAAGTAAYSLSLMDCTAHPS